MVMKAKPSHCSLSRTLYKTCLYSHVFRFASAFLERDVDLGDDVVDLDAENAEEDQQHHCHKGEDYQVLTHACHP